MVMDNTAVLIAEANPDLPAPIILTNVSHCQLGLFYLTSQNKPRRRAREFTGVSIGVTPPRAPDQKLFDLTFTASVARPAD